MEAGVRYSRNSTSSGWALCTSDFTISGTVPSHIDLIFGGDWQIRIDDVKLIPLDAQASQTISFENRQYPWPELPETLSPSSDYKYITHRANTVKTGQEVRNYTACYDTRRHNPMWVASAHHACYLEGSGRTYPDPWRPDPEMTEAQQSIIYPYDYADWPWDANGNKPVDGSYYWSANYYTDEYFTKGHLLKSDDRRGRESDLNIQTFYPTNMTVQNSRLNQSVWSDLEGKVRSWSSRSDTLYVVTGCVPSESDFITDRAGNRVNVPAGYYKALLRYSASSTVGEYLGIAFYFDNSAPSSNKVSSSMCMTIDALEEKLDMNFFPRLTSEQEAAAEAVVSSWWWN